MDSLNKHLERFNNRPRPNHPDPDIQKVLTLIHVHGLIQWHKHATDEVKETYNKIPNIFSILYNPEFYIMPDPIKPQKHNKMKPTHYPLKTKDFKEAQDLVDWANINQIAIVSITPYMQNKEPGYTLFYLNTDNNIESPLPDYTGLNPNPDDLVLFNYKGTINKEDWDKLRLKWEYEAKERYINRTPKQINQDEEVDLLKLDKEEFNRLNPKT